MILLDLLTIVWAYASNRWLHEIVRHVVGSSVTEGGKNIARFLFRECTQQLEHKHEASS